MLWYQTVSVTICTSFLGQETMSLWQTRAIVFICEARESRYLFLTFCLEMIIDSQEVARKCARKSQDSFPQPPPKSASCINQVQYQNQEMGIGTLHRAYSDHTGYTHPCPHTLVWLYAILWHVSLCKHHHHQDTHCPITRPPSYGYEPLSLPPTPDNH